MSRELQEKLARIEAKYKKERISISDYFQQKWPLLQKLHSQQELVKPVINSPHKKCIKDSLGNEFNLIPAGPFIFGSDNEFGVLSSDIYMAKYPVTVHQFRTFLDSSDWSYADKDLEKMTSVSPEANCPVSQISWLDAKEYCRWLRIETQEYYSLPSEYEWELAARGIDGRMYSWGYEEADENFACFRGKVKHVQTVPNGNYKKNVSPFGCMDMIGNVWEWCVESFDDPRNPHILRGGSWCNRLEFANCTSKTFSHPEDKRIDYAGFRIIYLPGEMLTKYREKAADEIDYFPKKDEAEQLHHDNETSQSGNKINKVSIPTPKSNKAALAPDQDKAVIFSTPTSTSELQVGEKFTAKSKLSPTKGAKTKKNKKLSINQVDSKVTIDDLELDSGDPTTDDFSQISPVEKSKKPKIGAQIKTPKEANAKNTGRKKKGTPREDRKTEK